MKSPAPFLGVLLTIFTMNAKANSSAEIGALVSTGNSESASVRTALDHSSETSAFRSAYAAVLSFQRSKSNGQSQTSSQRFAASAQSNYKLESQYSLFGRAAYVNDRFASYRQDASLVAGAGAWLIKAPASSFEIVSGPGFRYAQNDLGTESGLLWYAAGRYQRELGQNAFQQSLEVSQSLEGQNSTLLSRTSYVSAITGSLSLRVAFDVRHDSQPAPTRRSTSTETSVSVQLAF